jgi:hypothetical protein
MARMTTAIDVAQWMFGEVMRRSALDQETAAHQIQMKFGKEFLHENENGNWAINKDVLAAFRKLTGDSIGIAALVSGARGTHPTNLDDSQINRHDRHFPQCAQDARTRRASHQRFRCAN